MASIESFIKGMINEVENVTFDISSKVSDIPEKYIPCLQESLKYLNSAMMTARASRILYKLEQNNGKQKIMVSHNGDKISYRNLTDINALLKKISSGEININKWNNVNDGNFKEYNYLIAAQKLNKYRGKMIIKKLNNGEYSMKTYIEIPVDDRFNS